MISISTINLLYALVGILVGGTVVILWSRFKADSLLNKAQRKLSQVEEEIRVKQREADLEKKETIHKIRDEFEKETKEKRNELHKLSKAN